MTAVSGVRAPMNASASTRATSVRGAPLLPAPVIATPADFQDATLVLMVAQIGQAAGDRVAAGARQQEIKTKSDSNMKKELEATAKQREAERAARGFWGFLKKIAGAIAKIAAVVASTVSAVFTGGATLPMACAIATVALSGGAMIVRETKIFGELSAKIAFAMDLGAAATSLGGGFASAGTAADAVTNTMRKVGSVASEVDAGAKLVGAGAGVVVNAFERDAGHALADAEEARGKMQLLAQERQMLIEWFGQIAEVERDAIEGTTKTLAGMQQATDVAIAGVRA